MPDFTNQVAIVTGASSGIGAQTAVEFARAGASVVLVARRTEELHKIAEKCQQAGAKKEQVLVVTADVTDEEQGKRAVQETIKTFGRINVLFNNAGSTTPGTLEKSSVHDLDTMFKVHVKSTYIMSQACLPYLLETKGNIVNMSSLFGTCPVETMLAYSVAKAAVTQLTKCAALELASKGVRVNAVCPGVIETPLFGKVFPDLKDPAKYAQAMKLGEKSVPMDRNGSSDEVAAAVLFLASDAASFTTGCCMPIDGGRYITMKN